MTKILNMRETISQYEIIKLAMQGKAANPWRINTHTRQEGSSARWPKRLFRGFKNMYSIKDGIALAPQQNRPSSTASANKSYSSQHTIIKNRCKTYTHTHTYALIVNILWSKDQVSRDSGTAGSSNLWTEHENSIPLQWKKK